MLNWWILLGNVTIINVILSGDNALAISMAASKLPKLLRMKAVVLGTIIAIVSLIGFIAAGTFVIKLPLVKSIAALMLIFIAVKLTKDQFKARTPESTQEVVPSSGLMRAIGMIILADLGMSMDNAITMVSVANGRMSILLVSLLISIPILVVASHLIANVMERFPWITYLASGYIAWLSGNMFAEDMVWQGTLLGSTLKWIAPLTSVLFFLVFLVLFTVQSRRQHVKVNRDNVESWAG